MPSEMEELYGSILSAIAALDLSKVAMFTSITDDISEFTGAWTGELEEVVIVIEDALYAARKTYPELVELIEDALRSARMGDLETCRKTLREALERVRAKLDEEKARNAKK